MCEADQDLARAVRDASERLDVSESIARVYEDLQQQIDRRKPVCDASGACCHFDAYGHRLYVTTLELAAFVAGYRAKQLSDARRVNTTRPDGRSLSNLILRASSDPGGCTFQVDGLCGVHDIRPFGCRIFFCDPTAAQWQQDAYELFHARLKQEHARLGVPYFYVEWRQALTTLDLRRGGII